jgi:predicted secreted protein
MSNPTSNFNWQMPTATDLVTDLPADFEVFGQAVDTSLADLKGGTTGQILAKNTSTDMDFVWTSSAASGLDLITRSTFSNVANTGTIFDGVFSSTYKTYLIAIENLYAAVANNDLYFQYRVGATTTAGAAYHWNNFILLSNATTAIVGANGASQIQLSRNCGQVAYPGAGEFWVNKVGNSSMDWRHNNDN